MFELPVHGFLSLARLSMCGGAQSLCPHFSLECVQQKHGTLRGSVCPCGGHGGRPGCRGEAARPCHRGENTAAFLPPALKTLNCTAHFGDSILS